MAAPKKDVVKDKQLKVKVTRHQLDEIRLKAKKQGLNVSQYVLLSTIGSKKQ
jgi:predicted DNA binding CopG/RHH family protein